METNEIEKLSSLAATVAANAADHAAAIASEREAAAAFLDAVIEKVRPALRALSSRIKSSDASTSGRNGCNPVEEIAYHNERGVELIGSFCRDKDETGNRGTYSGTKLYLLSEGRFAHVEKSGDWSCWQGEWDRENFELTALTTAEVAATYDAGEREVILAALTKKLTEQAEGAATTRAAAARDRAAKLTAVTALLAD